VRANDANNEEMSDKRYDSRFVRVTCGFSNGVWSMHGVCVWVSDSVFSAGYGIVWDIVHYIMDGRRKACMYVYTSKHDASNE
jgi:hypothetical protein